MKTDQELQTDGYTESGISRYRQTVEEYSDALYSKSVTFGEADKAKNLPLEVTHEHVRAAAYTIAKSYGKDHQSPWMIASNVGEYLFTAVAGIGGGNLDKPWGTPVFGVALAIAVILIVVRLVNSK